MKIRPIYHLHIPRTSGTEILRELEKVEAVCAQRASDQRGFAKLQVYVPGEYEFILPPVSELENYNFFSGHFAANPVQDFDNPVVFALVREPVSQYLSTITYRCLRDGVVPTRELVDKHINNYFYNSDVHEPLFNGASNTQSRFMVSRFVEVYDPYADATRSVFEDKKLDVDEVKDFVDNHIVGTLACRDQVISKVNVFMLKQFGVKLNSNAAKVNASQPIKFDLTNSQLKKIKEKTQVDEEIYQYIKMKENKNAKQL
jgi:hypothetical protein